MPEQWIEQVVRLACLPLALGLFLCAAQVFGGLVPRDAPLVQVGLR